MSKRYKCSPLNFDADELSLTSAIVFVRKDVFSHIGGFDSRLFPGEDPEFFSRAKKLGYSLIYTPYIFIYHRRRPTLRLMIKQFFKYGYVRLALQSLLEQQASLVFFIPSLFLLYLIFLVPLVLFIHELFILPFLFYILLILGFSFKQAVVKKTLLWPLLWPFYFIIHLSYGAGMLWYFLNS